MATLASQDMEEVSRQMEESEFAQPDMESELLLRFAERNFNSNILQNILQNDT